MPRSIASGEQLINMSAACKLFPRRPSVASIHRWRQGVGTKGVRLECIRIGGMYYTTESAVEQFMRACNATDEERLVADGC